MRSNNCVLTAFTGHNNMIYLQLKVKSGLTLTPAAAEAPDSASDSEYEDEVVQVPYQYQVEEIQEKEVIQEQMVERKVPQVKCMYAYQGQGIKVAKGEVSYYYCRDENYLSI